MSRTAVIVALLIAIGLGVAALFLTGRGHNQPASTGPLLVFDQTRVEEIRITFPDGTFQAVHRDPTGDWNAILGAPGRPSRSWPATTTQVHPAIRILSSLIPDRPGEGSLKTIVGTLSITAGPTPITLRISDQRLAGKVLVEADGPPKRSGWVDAQIADMLVVTGIQAWRNAAALPGLGPEASRVLIKSHSGSTLTLARVQGKWALREPIAEPADTESVNRLFQTLAAARITDFCDKGPPSQTGLDTPVATLTVESDFRDPSGGAATTVKQSLIVGQAADIAGKTVVARLDREVSGSPASGDSEIMILAAEHLAAINTDPLAYIAKQAAQTPAAEIGKVVVKPSEGPMRTYWRSLDGWDVATGDAKPAPAPLADSQSLGALLELLSATPAEKISLRAPVPADSPAAAIELSSLGGTPLGSVQVAIQGTKLVVLNDNVRREYAAGVGAQAAEWLGRR